MKKSMRMMAAAIAAISGFALSSCGGGSGSVSDSKFFGKVPGLYVQMMEKKDALKEQFKTCSSEEEGKKLMAEAEKAEQKYSTEIEEAAKALDGKTIEIESNSQFTVNGPVTLTFDGFQSKSDLTPRFKLTGEVVAAENYQSEDAKSLSGDSSSKYAGMAEHVYLVGTDARGTELFSQKVAYFQTELIEAERLGVKTGTALKFETLTINNKNAEGCAEAVALHLSYKPE